MALKLKSLPFYDSDQAVVERTGVSVTWIFDVEGEPKFREREADVIDELTQYDGLVLEQMPRELNQ